VGDQQAKLMVIGEAPGFYEDQQGEPFVGRAGQLLNAMLQAIHLQRSQVYIANILKCRPPNNRDPLPEEIARCTGFLDRQIALLEPQLLVAVGRISAHYLLNTKKPLSALRGHVYHYGKKQIPLLVTYHPAYLLRNPRDKANAYGDLQLISKHL
jgi:DNA polymerase